MRGKPWVPSTRCHIIAMVAHWHERVITLCAWDAYSRGTAALSFLEFYESAFKIPLVTVHMNDQVHKYTNTPKHYLFALDLYICFFSTVTKMSDRPLLQKTNLSW